MRVHRLTTAKHVRWINYLYIFLLQIVGLRVFKKYENSSTVDKFLQ